MSAQQQQIDPVRVNAILAELTQQRDYAFARASGLAADLASLGERVKALEAQNKAFQDRLEQNSAVKKAAANDTSTPIPFSLINNGDAA